MKRLFTAVTEFFKTPAGAIMGVWMFWLAILFYVIYSLNLLNTSLPLIGAFIFLDLIAGGILVDRFVYLYSQFVLPIKNEKDRQEIYNRVVTSPDKRGPTIFIKNGKVIESKGETVKRKGKSGLIILDTASAAVLRTETEIKGAIGPGYKFIAKDEFIAGVTDLRSQWRFVGPLESEHPFTEPQIIDIDDGNNDVNNQWDQTIGLTRDGFEVAPTISIKFRIKRPERAAPTPSGTLSNYGYDPEAVFKAITREVIYLDKKNQKERLRWSRLPEHIVINLWREYVRKFKLSDLIPSKPEDASQLSAIEAMINLRVAKKDIMKMGDFGQPTSEWVPSMEFVQLDERGLEIMEVRIENIQLRTNMEEQIISQWGTDWTMAANKEKKQNEDRARLKNVEARKLASYRFSRVAATKFAAKTPRPITNPFKALQLLIEPLKNDVFKESSISPELHQENEKMETIWRWLLDNNIPSNENGNGGGSG